MSLDDIISVNISAAQVAATTELTTIPLLVAPDAPAWTDGEACHSYTTVADMLADGFESDSRTVAHARLLLSQANYPGTFFVGRKAGDTLATGDLDAIQAQDDSWYGFTVVDGTDGEIETAANWALSQRKLQVAATASTDSADASKTDSLAATLHGQASRRTALLVSPKSAALGIASAWMGGQLPLTPGTNTWAYKTLNGIEADTFTSAQLRATIGVSVDETAGNGSNVYISRAGVGATQFGSTSSGEWIDNVVGEDWLVFNLQSQLFNILKNSGKVPYTNKGVSLLLAACHGVLDQATINGLVSSETPYTIIAPDVSTALTSDKIARRGPTITIACTLAGAINSVKLVLNITQ